MKPPVIELANDVFNCWYASFIRNDNRTTVPVDIFLAGLEHCLPSYQIDRSGFPVFLLEFLADGEAELRVNGEVHHLRSGAAYWYGPGIPCRFVNLGQKPLVKYFFAFHCEEGSPREVYGLGRNVIGSNRGGERVREWVRMLFEEACHEQAQSWRIGCSLLDIILLECVRSEALERNARDRAFTVFREVKDTISTHYLELRNMQDISRKTGLCASYVSRLFKRYYHTTAYEFLQQRQMDHAFDLLRQGNFNVQAAASQAGFDDPFHFSRLFKKYKGIPPSEAR